MALRIFSDALLTPARRSAVTLVLLLVFGVWIWANPGRLNPIDELSLIRHGQGARAVLVNVDERDTDDGVPFDIGTYSFRSPDGRDFNTFSETARGSLKQELEVEYLPDDPRVNRIKGDGIDDVSMWLWHRLGGGALILLLLIFFWYQSVDETKSKGPRSTSEA